MITPEETAFRQAQADYDTALQRYEETKAQGKLDVATAKRRKGEAYRLWTMAQAEQARQLADRRAARYQTPKDDAMEPEASPRAETAEERRERIIEEMHQANLKLEREGKW